MTISHTVGVRVPSKAIHSRDGTDRNVDLHRLVSEQDTLIFEMRTLLDSGKGLSNILRLGILLDTCMAIVRERYGCKNSTALLKDDLDPTKELYAVKAFHNLDPEYPSFDGHSESLFLFKFPQDNGLLWQIIKQGKVFSVLTFDGKPRFAQAFEHWSLNVLHSQVWCPLIKGSEILGILTFGEFPPEISPFNTEFSFLQEFTSIASTNIDATLKYEKNERILRNIKTLYDVNQQLTNVNDFKKLCRETLAKAIDAVGAQKGNLMLLNKETNKLEIRVVWGMIPEHVREGINSGAMETTAVSIGEGIAGRCAQTKKPIRVNNKDEIPNISKFEVHCMCSVPVLHGDRFEGVINMTNKVRKDAGGEFVLDKLGRFTEEDMNLLVGLADQAARGLNKAKLYTESITDRLTELSNTRHFEEMFSKEFDESLNTGKPMSLAVTDIDHFKKFNDTYGHKAGDAVLKEIARLFALVRRSDSDDMAFRYGGEEFCMILPDTTPDEAACLMEAFRKKVQTSSVHYEGNALQVTVSVGIASSLFDTRDPKELFKLADECLYKCKESGRNQVRVFLAGTMAMAEEGIDKELMQIYLMRKKAA
jgi:diguanylate cyclase (GGDEF)-like protein